MKTLITLLILVSNGFLFGQTDYSTIPLKTTADCKAAEPQVLVAADFVLSKPIHDDADVKSPEAFILTWINNCEYSFLVDSKIDKIEKDDKNLLFIFMTCEAKYLLENISKAKDQKAICLGAYSMLANYASDPANGVKANKYLQKLIDAKKNGTIQEWYDEK